jgi:hypothetical protein
MNATGLTKKFILTPLNKGRKTKKDWRKYMLPSSFSHENICEKIDDIVYLDQ